MNGLRAAPGCWDPLSALLIEQAGFDLAILSGSALSMTALGRPDLGLVDLALLADTVARIRDRVGLTLYVDADTGFGGTLNVQHSVRRLERAGADIIQIEDQQFPKRCGHLAGKAVVDAAAALGRVRAALDARHDAMICARTDAASVLGLDAAIERAEGFVEAGADLVFVECKTMVEASRVAARLSRHATLVCNCVADGGLDEVAPQSLAQIGYSVALHPLLLLGGLAECAPRLLAGLRSGQSPIEALPGVHALNHITGVDALLAIAASFEGQT